MTPSQGDEDLDDWEFVQEIGRGSRCVVHKAVCLRGRLCSRVLAIKVPLPHRQSSCEATQASGLTLQQELHHPNILALYSLIPHSGVQAQVLEYCPLGTLAEYMDQNSVTVSKAMLVMRGIANALVYLHERRIVHRAIQPSHILLDSGHTPKLSHFDSATRQFLDNDTRCPYTNYTAPEIVEGEQGGCPADIWSLGCVALHMISGRPPTASLVNVDDILQNLSCDIKIRVLLSDTLKTVPSERVTASVLALTKFSHLHTNAPVDRVGSLHDHKDNPKVNPATKDRQGKVRLRRMSLEDFKHQRLKRLLLDKFDSQPLRRIVSDPLTTRVNSKVSTVEESIPMVSEDRFVLRDLNFNVPPGSEVPNEELRCDPGAVQYIDSSRLRPQSQMCRDACISVLHDKRIFVESREPLTRGEAKKAMLIDSPQNQIYIYENLLSQDFRQTSPSAQYTRESLPISLLKYYDSASLSVEEMKRRTPKFVVFTVDGKLTLMANGPPGDVEASFSPFTFTGSSASEPSNEQDVSTLRIRYSEDQGLIELRRYVEAPDGKVWTKKCMASKFHLRDISQLEWNQLDNFEKDGLSRLMKFSQVCKNLETMEALKQVNRPSIQEISRAKPMSQCNDTSALDTPVMPRRPNKLH